mmetsp:Transcript_4924/g.13799  ORF Transcript_4924/g.13799 Transcript_4924/m.13799 type:complete len:490 (-) Transcript_4924:65-1534(-)
MGEQQQHCYCTSTSSKCPSPEPTHDDDDEQQQQQQQPQEEEEDLASQATSMGTIDATLNCGASSVGTIGTKLLDGMDEDDDDIDVDNPKDEEDDDDDESEASFFNNVVQRNQLDKETQKPTSQHRFPTSIQCRPPPRQVSVPTTTVAAATGNNNDDDDDDATGTASIATLEFSAIGSIGTTPSMSQGLEGSSSNHHHHHHHRGGQDDEDHEDDDDDSSVASFFHQVVKKNKLKGGRFDDDDNEQPKRKKQKTGASTVIAVGSMAALTTPAVAADDTLSHDGLATITSIGTLDTTTFLKDQVDEDDASQASFFAKIVQENNLKEKKTPAASPSSSSSPRPSPSAKPTKEKRKAKVPNAMALMATSISHEPIDECDWGEHDVPLGRRKEVRTYIGNVRFRQIIDQHRPKYQTFTRKAEKTRMAKEIFFIIKHRGGRFLDPRKLSCGKNKSKVEWFEITPDKAQAKISQALRNGTRPLKSDNDHDQFHAQDC